MEAHFTEAVGCYVSKADECIGSANHCSHSLILRSRLDIFNNCKAGFPVTQFMQRASELYVKNYL